MQVHWLKENAFELFLSSFIVCYLLSMHNFKKNCSFNALLKGHIGIVIGQFASKTWIKKLSFE
jgi:hypothetical protein